MGLIAGALLTVLLVVYMFWPERGLMRQTEKTRVDYLQERKETIYENLRDLRFEYLAGKHPEPAGVLMEIDTLETSSVARKGR